MKFRISIVISLCFVVAILGISSRPCLAAGDRNLDTNVSYPSSAWVQNGGRVINIRNTGTSGITQAVGNGAADDTNAFKSAYTYIANQFVNTSGSTSYILWIPNGTYLVTDSLIYTRPWVQIVIPPNTLPLDINNLRLIGQSRAGTVIQLANACSGFLTSGSAKAVIRFQHPNTTFNNLQTSNLCENLTVNVGSGNPGAVAIQFQGANSAKMSNVQLTSNDGGGLYGLWFPIGSLQAYLKDITITGFDNAVCSAANPEVFSAFEHLTCTNQHKAAISIPGGGVTLRDMVSNQSAYHAPAVQFSPGQTGGSVVLLDSQLNGGSSTSPAVVITGTQQDCFARNTSVSGYTVAVQQSGTTAVSGSFISEYSAYNPTTTLFAGQDTHSYAMAPQDTPMLPLGDPSENTANWVNVETYRSGTNSDTVTMTKAFAAAATGGNSVVYFPRLTYDIESSVYVPACVNRVDFMFSTFTGWGNFVVSATSANPVTFVGKSGQVPILISGARTVVADLLSGNLTNTQSAPVTSFIECCTNMGAGTQFCTANQMVFARSINDE